VRIEINDESITYAKGMSGIVGPDEVLLDRDDNLVAGTSWEQQGYTVEPFLPQEAQDRLREGISDLIRDLLVQHGVELREEFVLEQYHHALDGRDDVHLQVARAAARGFPFRQFPIAVDRVIARIGEICRKPLRCGDPAAGEDVFNLRVIRPRSNDNSPLHRDVWLDHLRNAVNIYVPLAGSNHLSSLALVPGSHLWKESEIERTESGAVINAIRYTVPAVVGAARCLEVVRPDPQSDQVLVFSPYMIHGGATNLNPDRTRVSLEMRFWRDKA